VYGRIFSRSAEGKVIHSWNEKHSYMVLSSSYHDHQGTVNIQVVLVSFFFTPKVGVPILKFFAHKRYFCWPPKIEHDTNPNPPEFLPVSLPVSMLPSQTFPRHSHDSKDCSIKLKVF